MSAAMLRYYYSGIFPFKEAAHNWAIPQCPQRLLSMHGGYVKYGQKWCDRLQYHPGEVEILLDSGAFTGWNCGHEVELDPLCQVYELMLNKYWEHTVQIWLISLDKIPGSPGRDPEEWEIEQACAFSDKNFEILVKRFGPRVLPVYHQGENQQRLDEVVKQAEYICVSPRNDLAEVHRVKWSREVHSKIPKTTKTHGLAATGMDMMTTVPWYSVDSATAVFIGATGDSILCMKGTLINMGFSSKSPKRHDRNQHYCNLNSVSKKAVDEYLETMRFTPELLAESAEARVALIIMSTNKWNREFHKFTPVIQGSLFDL